MLKYIEIDGAIIFMLAPPTFLTVVVGCLPCLVGAYWIFLTAMLTLAISSPARLART